MSLCWINNCKIDWERGEVSDGDNIRSVEPRAMSVLKVLIDANGSVVTQQYLLESVWDNVIVAPNTLQRCIAQLRKAFNDDAKKQSVIKTHPKLGYSLVPQIFKTEPLNSVPKKMSIGLLITILLASLIFLIFYVITLKEQPKVLSQITMITSDDEPQYSGVMIKNTLFFIQGNEAFEQQLKSKNLTSGIVKTILSQQWFKGGLTIDHGNNTLLYSTITLTDNNLKCSNVTALNVTSFLTQELVGCDLGFKFNGQVIADSTLLYLQQESDNSVSLIKRDLMSKKEQVIGHELGVIHRIAVHKADQQIAVVSESNHQYYLSILNLSINSLELIKRWNINPALAQSNIHWNHKNRIYMVSTQAINWFDIDGSPDNGELALANKDSLYSAMKYDDRFIVEIGRDDWDVNQSPLMASSAKQTLIRSTYADYWGRYRPYHEGTSFLSTRSGIAQLWLEDKQGTFQLTKGQSEVTSYAWSVDGEEVAVVSNGALQLIHVNGDSIQLPFKEYVQQVYQYFLDDNNQPSLLLAIGQLGNDKLVKLNILKNEMITVAHIPTRWAQRVSFDRYVTNSTSGHLQQVVISDNKTEISIIEKTKTNRLQWRFFYQDGSIYFQDKEQQVLRYSLSTKQLTPIGRYDEHSLLMTDIAPKQQMFLSNAFIRKVRDLAFVD